MRKLYAIMLACLLPATVLATDVGVSISVGQPGFYGRIDIGTLVPRLLYPQPVIIAPPYGVPPPPVYLHVPPGHAKRWRDHCHEYAACGRGVYFVQPDWYERVYVPEYRAHPEKYRKKGGKRKRAKHDDHDHRD